MIMGGRITEMFDFINAETEEITERKNKYCCFSVSRDDMTSRRAFLIANKIPIQNKKPASGQIKLF